MRVLLLITLFFASPTAFALKVGEKFPDIQLNRLNSKLKFDSREMKGKVVLIDIWGSDCPPCRLAMPKMNSIFQKLRKKNFVILGINVDEHDDDVKFFLSEYKIDYPLLDDRKHELVKRLDVQMMPTSFLLDGNGIVRYVHKGFRSGDAEILEHKIRALLAKSI